MLKLFGLIFYPSAVEPIHERNRLNSDPMPLSSLHVMLSVSSAGLSSAGFEPDCASPNAWVFVSVGSALPSTVCFPLSAPIGLQRLRLREAHQWQVHPGLLVPSVVHVQELHHGDDLPQQHWVSRRQPDHSHTPSCAYFILFAFKWQNIWYFKRGRLWHIQIFCLFQPATVAWMIVEASNTKYRLWPKTNKSIFLKERPEPAPVTTGFEADSLPNSRYMRLVKSFRCWRESHYSDIVSSKKMDLKENQAVVISSSQTAELERLLGCLMQMISEAEHQAADWRIRRLCLWCLRWIALLDVVQEAPRRWIVGRVQSEVRQVQRISNLALLSRL